MTEIGMRWKSVSDLSWEKYYSSAKRYYEAHGNLKVSVTYIDENGVNLGSWLSRRRTWRKSNIKIRMLSPKKVEALDKIGMIWDVPDYIFEENYAAAVRYHLECWHPR